MRIHAVTMPKWGVEMKAGLIATWLVAEGQPVRVGDPLADVETDKIVNALEAPATGVLARILAPSGNSYAVGQLIAMVTTADVSAAELHAFVTAFVPATID